MSKSVCVWTGSWVAHPTDNMPYIQADLITRHHVFSVTTQGSPIFAQWVESYAVSYGIDGTNWIMISMAFLANSDQDTKVTNTLPDGGILARYIRLHPIGSNTVYKSLRWDVIGCESCVVRYLICNGTEDPVVNVTASSIYRSGSDAYSPSHACLDRADGRKVLYIPLLILQTVTWAAN